MDDVMALWRQIWIEQGWEIENERRSRARRPFRPHDSSSRCDSAVNGDHPGIHPQNAATGKAGEALVTLAAQTCSQRWDLLRSTKGAEGVGQRVALEMTALALEIRFSRPARRPHGLPCSSSHPPNLDL